MLPNDNNNDQELEQFLKEFEENAEFLKDDSLGQIEDLEILLDDPEPEAVEEELPVAAPKKKRSWKKTALITVSCFLAVVVLLLGGVALYMNHLFGLITRPNEQLGSHPSDGSSLTLPPEETVDSNHTGPTMDATDVTMPSGPADVIDAEHIINIMLLGEDEKGGYYRGRTDSMILCTINTKNNTVTMTSFLRDLYVTIPGMGNNRLNAAYVYGGFDLFRETMLWNFGVEIDDIVKVEFEVFATVVDILGGVDITLTQAEADYLNSKYPWTVSAGAQRLNGEQAFAYSRIRKIDSDFGRTQRQQKVLLSIFNAYKTKPLGEMLDITERLLPNLTVTMSQEDIWGYLVKFVPMLSGLTVNSQQIPAQGTYQGVVIDGMAVLVPDLEANRAIIEGIIYAQ